MTPALQKALVDMREQQKYYVQQLTKFRINSESAKNRTNSNYWKWFNHWHAWHHGISDEQWNETPVA